MIPMDIINLYENYNNYFNSEFKEIFKLCCNLASDNNYKIYLIGGLVRDMILERKSLDIDITIQGDAIKFAELLKQTYGAKIISIHKDFGTVKVELLKQKIDFASSRNEIYPKKGHLPVVQLGCLLEEDVLRRDFTINSLALSLNKENFAQLIDFVGGYNDLKNKKIKILHLESFIDDPTRIIRALKYACRLGFEIDKKTKELQKEYLNNINYDMCYKRIKQEIKKTFSEESACVFDKFMQSEVYKLLAPNFRPKQPFIKSSEIETLIQKFKPKNKWLIEFGIIAISLPEETLDKLELTKEEKNIILGAKNIVDAKFKNEFEIYKAFCSQKLEVAIILAAFNFAPAIKYLYELKDIKIKVKGQDIIEMGFQPSKNFSKALDYLLKEKLKTPKMTKSQELGVVKKYLKINA